MENPGREGVLTGSREGGVLSFEKKGGHWENRYLVHV